MGVTNNNNCKNLVKIIEDKNFQLWTGLPAHCSIDEFLILFKRYADSTGTGMLGKNHEKCPYRMASLDSYESPLRIWFKDKEVVKIDIKYPKMDTKLFDQLGIPEGKLDYFLGNFKMPEAEWVFASRGISVIQNADYTQIIEIVLFKPMSFEQYKNNIYYRVETREF